MSDEWPDDWPMSAIREIESRDDKIERLRETQRKFGTLQHQFMSENERLRGLLREAEALLCDERAGRVGNELAVKIRAALGAADQPGADEPRHMGLIDCMNRDELAAYDQGCAESMAAVKAILDGEDDGSGTCNEPWESIRRRLIALA